MERQLGLVKGTDALNGSARAAVGSRVEHAASRHVRRLFYLSRQTTLLTLHADLGDKDLDLQHILWKYAQPDMATACQVFEVKSGNMMSHQSD